MVVKEIWVHALAYSLIRGVIAAATEAHEKEQRKISFAGALQTMAAFRGPLAMAPPEAHLLLTGCQPASFRRAKGEFIFNHVVDMFRSAQLDSGMNGRAKLEKLFKWPNQVGSGQDVGRAASLAALPVVAGFS
jgi:hypothetical protein